MPRAYRSAPCLVFCLAVASACSDRGSDDPNPTSDGGVEGGLPDPDSGVVPDADVGALCAEYARLECNDWKRCAGVPFTEATFGSYEGCLVRTEEQCRVWSELAGSATKASDRLACSRAWSTRACGDPGPIPECDFPRGQLEHGVACLVNQQCASGHCDRSSEASCGVCQDRRAPGAACERSAQCESRRCERRVCTPVFKAGDTCNVNFCSNLLICANSVCTPIRWLAAGERCDVADALCSDGTCLNGICATDRVAEIGEPCVSRGGEPLVRCREGECNPDSNQCEKRPSVGAACVEREACAGSAVCASGQCKALSPDVCATTPPSARTDSYRREPDPAIEKRAADGRLLGFRD